MLKKAVSKAAGRSATEAYPWGTLQGDERLRTKLADFFSILLAVLGETDQIQVVVVVGENRFCLVSEAHEQVDVPGGA